MAGSGLDSLAILVPALNEAATINSVVSAAGKYGRVIVIDNGSTDGTADVARDAGAEIVRLERPGYDAALNAGFARADELGLDYVLTMDADGQHDASDIPRFLDALERGNIAVHGIRHGSRRLAERLFAWITRRAWSIGDPLCGMKAYQMTLYRQRGHFDSCQSVGTELLLFAARSGMPVEGVEIRVGRRADRPRFGNALRANLTLLNAIWRALSASKPGRSRDSRRVSEKSNSTRAP